MEQLTDAYNFMNDVLTKYADQVLRSDPLPAVTTAPKKVVAPPTTTDGILRLKMRASPRNIVRV